MTEFETYQRNYRMMLTLFGLWLLAYALLNFVALPSIISLVYGAEVLQSLREGNFSVLSPQALRYLQIVHSGMLFLLPPLVLMIVFHERPKYVIGSVAFPPSTLLILGFSATILSLPFIYMSAEVNHNLPLPETAHELEKAATAQQNMLLGEKGWIAIVGNIITFAIVAPLAEEIFFRGALQKVIHKLTSHEHMPVILSALAFSFVHMEFEGFIPRFILGMMFGYMAMWSGNIWISVFCHCIYNGGQLLLYYLYVANVTAVEPDQDLSIPIYLSLFSLITTALVLKQFYTRTIIKPVIPE